MMPTLVPQVVVITTCGVTSWYHDVSRITVFIIYMIHLMSPTLSSLAALRVVIMTTCGAINDKIVGSMMTLGVLCTPQIVYRLTLEVSLDLEKYVWPFWVTIFGKQKPTKIDDNGRNFDKNLIDFLLSTASYYGLPSGCLHIVIMTSLLRQNDVAASFWRNNDIIITSCVLSSRIFASTVMTKFVPRIYT